jgi:hypothetical protein
VGHRLSGCATGRWWLGWTPERRERSTRQQRKLSQALCMYLIQIPGKSKKCYQISSVVLRQQLCLLFEHKLHNKGQLLSELYYNDDYMK